MRSLGISRDINTNRMFILYLQIFSRRTVMIGVSEIIMRVTVVLSRTGLRDSKTTIAFQLSSKGTGGDSMMAF